MSAATQWEMKCVGLSYPRCVALDVKAACALPSDILLTQYINGLCGHLFQACLRKDWQCGATAFSARNENRYIVVERYLCIGTTA